MKSTISHSSDKCFIQAYCFIKLLLFIVIIVIIAIYLRGTRDSRDVSRFLAFVKIFSKNEESNTWQI